MFCTRWNGLDKSGGVVDALDSGEYSGSLIILLDEGVGFVKRNSKTAWKKMGSSRLEMPEYCERSVFEALVNALIHRDYLILGSEVHIDMYDDRLTITSPGGMPDGTRIQDRNIESISSTRRNPVLADIFGRLGFMERQGSGFKKITQSYYTANNFKDGLEPRFYSDAATFQVTLFNLNYSKTGISEDKQIFDETQTGLSKNKQDFDENQTGLSDIKQDFAQVQTGLSDIKQDFAQVQTGLSDIKQDFTARLSAFDINVKTMENILKLYASIESNAEFTRSDVMSFLKLTPAPASELIRKMRQFNLIEKVKGRGKYRFIF